MTMYKINWGTFPFVSFNGNIDFKRMSYYIKKTKYIYAIGTHYYKIS